MKKWSFILPMYFVFQSFIGCNTPSVPPQPKSDQQTSKITWQNASIDLGKTAMGDTLHFYFAFTNSGDAPLIITEADGGCSCLQATGPSQPIMPGKTDSIRVSFNTNLSVTGWVRKNIRVVANTEPGTHRLFFSTEITGHKK